MKTKRILCGILATAICLSLFGCGGKEDDSNLRDPDTPIVEDVVETLPAYTPEENPITSAPKYESEKMSIQKFEDGFAYENEVNRAWIDAANGNILDLYSDSMFYTLTDKGIYFCSWVFDTSVIPVDPADNTKIHFVGYQNIVLSDNNGKVTIYYHEVGDDEHYRSYTDDDLVIGENNLLIVSHNMVSFDEDVFIIKNISKDGIVATVAESVWLDNDTITVQTTAVDKTIPFAESLNSDIKAIHFAQDNDAEGVIILENGDLYSFSLPTDGGSEGATIYLGEKIDTNVERVLKLWSSTSVQYTKSDDDTHFYYYTTGLDEESQQWVPQTAIMQLADGYVTADIVNAIVRRGLIQFSDGAWYSIAHHSVSSDYEMGITLKEFEKKYKDAIDFGFAPVVQDGKVVDLLAINWTAVTDAYAQSIIAGKPITDDWVLMDDGYIYECVDKYKQ